MASWTLAWLAWLGVGQSGVDAWPQWRGPTGDSVADAAKLPTRWSAKENVIWKTPLPGWGTSTPAIWGDAIFVTTQVDDKKLQFLRLDARTGKIVWQRDMGEGKPRRNGPVGIGRYHDEHNMASPSPITDGKHVWAHFGNGELSCFNFAGDKKWSLNLTEHYGPYSIWWGHANSPVLAGDLLILQCVQDSKRGGKSYLAALDKLTGKQRWYTERDTGAVEEPGDSYTTPILYRGKKRDELIVFGGNVLDAYDPATGKQLWRCGIFTGNRVISGPTLAGDAIYAIQGMKGPLFAVKAGGDKDVTKTHVAWKFTGQTPDAASPVVANGLVFLANNVGTVICLDARTGQQLWKERLADGFRATPLVSGGRIYLFGKEGKTTIVAASRTFNIVGGGDLGDDMMASPAVAGNDLVLRTRSHLYRIGNRERAPEREGAR